MYGAHLQYIHALLITTTSQNQYQSAFSAKEAILYKISQGSANYNWSFCMEMSVYRQNRCQSHNSPLTNKLPQFFKVV